MEQVWWPFCLCTPAKPHAACERCSWAAAAVGLPACLHSCSAALPRGLRSVLAAADLSPRPRCTSPLQLALASEKASDSMKQQLRIAQRKGELLDAELEEQQLRVAEERRSAEEAHAAEVQQRDEKARYLPSAPFCRLR